MAIDLVAVLRLDDQMTASMKKLAGVATVGFAAIGAAAVAATNKFAEIDAELRRTASLSGATSEEFQLLTQAATDMGSTTTKSMTEISASMSELAANGMNANEVMAAMPGIIAASEASGESLAVAASTVSAALNTWGLEATESAKVADILTMAANVSAAGIDDMSYALKYAGAPAAALGMDLAQVSAAIGAMVDSGIDGSSAGTALRAALLALNNPAKAQAKIMDSLGVSITDSAGEAKSLVDIVRNMEDATRSMTGADRLATVAKLVGTEAASGFLALMSRGPDELAKMTDALRNSSGLAQATADEMNQGVMALMVGIKSQFEALGFAVGKGLEPISSRLLSMIKGIDFSPLVKAAAVVGDVMGRTFDVIADNWSKIAPIIKPIGAIVAGVAASFMLFGGASAIFLALSTVIGFISGPVAAVAVGFGAIAGLLGLLMTKAGPVKDFFMTLKEVVSGGLFTGILERDEGAVALAVKVGTGIKGAFEKVSDFIATFKQLASGGLMSGILERDEGAVAMAVTVFTTLKNAFDTVVNFVREKIVQLQPTLAMLSAGFTSTVTTVTTILMTLWSIAGPILSLLWNAIQIVADVVVIAFNNIIAPAFMFVTKLVSVMWSVVGPILSLIGVAIGVLGQVIKLMWDTILAPFVDYWTTGLAKALEIVMPILDTVGSVFETIGGYISSAAEKVKDFIGAIKDVKIPDAITNLGSGAMSLVSKVIPDGSHKTGLWSVPFDGYLAELHKSEIVLPAEEATAYRSIVGNSGSLNGVSGVDNVSYDSASAGITTNNNNYDYSTNTIGQSGGSQQESKQTPRQVVINMNNTVREEADIDKIGRVLVQRLIEAEAAGV